MKNLPPLLLLSMLFGCHQPVKIYDNYLPNITHFERKNNEIEICLDSLNGDQAKRLSEDLKPFLAIKDVKVNVFVKVVNDTTLLRK